MIQWCYNNYEVNSSCILANVISPLAVDVFGLKGPNWKQYAQLILSQPCRVQYITHHKCHIGNIDAMTKISIWVCLKIVYPFLPNG